MIDLLRTWLGIDVRELDGATFSGEIPFTAALINRFIAERLARDGSGKLAAVVVEPHDDDRLRVNVRLRSKLLPPLRLELQIAAQPDFPAAPVLVLRWSLVGGLGALARLASPALGIFDLLPPGVRVNGELIGIDVSEMLRAKNADWVLAYVRTLQVRIRDGRVVVGLSVGV